MLAEELKMFLHPQHLVCLSFPGKATSGKGSENERMLVLLCLACFYEIRLKTGRLKGNQADKVDLP